MQFSIQGSPRGLPDSRMHVQHLPRNLVGLRDIEATSNPALTENPSNKSRLGHTAPATCEGKFQVARVSCHAVRNKQQLSLFKGPLTILVDIILNLRRSKGRHVFTRSPDQVPLEILTRTI